MAFLGPGAAGVSCFWSLQASSPPSVHHFPAHHAAPASRFAILSAIKQRNTGLVSPGTIYGSAAGGFRDPRIYCMAKQHLFKFPPAYLPWVKGGKWRPRHTVGITHGCRWTPDRTWPALPSLMKGRKDPVADASGTRRTAHRHVLETAGSFAVRRRTPFESWHGSADFSSGRRITPICRASEHAHFAPIFLAQTDTPTS